MNIQNENEAGNPGTPTDFLPSGGASCSLSLMPDTGEWSQHYRDLARLARTLENEAEFYKSALSLVPVVDVNEIRKRLYELPELVLANEKKNPAWSKAELWGIERDIIPSVRALCWSAAAILPPNVYLKK